MSAEAGGVAVLRSVLERYDTALLRHVADNLLRSRLQRARDDLIDKMVEAAGNAAVIDRRLQALDEPQRGLLALLGLGRRAQWELTTVLELLACLGATDGLAVVQGLFEAGLLYPELSNGRAALRRFKDWLTGAPAHYRIVAPAGITSRAASQAIGSKQPATAAHEAGFLLPSVASCELSNASPREADGLEWFLRLGCLWQDIHQQPPRLTQQGAFFKKDHERLEAALLLTHPAADELHAVPQLGHALVSLGIACGLLERQEGQIIAGAFPESWQAGLLEAVTEFWSLLPAMHSWNAAEGWRGLSAGPPPYASANLLAMALLALLPGSAWVMPQAIGDWIAARHCFWPEARAVPGTPARRTGPVERDLHEGRGRSTTTSGTQSRPSGRTHPLSDWAESFLLGIAYQFRLVQAAQDSGGRWLVRLAPLGRAVLGLGPPPRTPAFPKTLLVQPNMEILAYRQGLTPGLIADLTRFASWQSLGPACTLRVEPETVYRGLEHGASLETIVRLLQQHGVREPPPGVLESLKTWANKRERLTVYGGATLLEFATAEDAQSALSRGLAGLRLADRLVLVTSAGDIDFRHFRLTATRDYALPPGQCVEVGADGVTLYVDPARSDLLLDSEIARFAEPAVNRNGTERRSFRLTPQSLARGRASGMTLWALEEWFRQRAGQPLSPAGALLFAGGEMPPLAVKRLLVLELPTAALADGLLQWPETRPLIQDRLGPRAVVVDEAHLDPLRAKVRELGLPLDVPPDAASPAPDATEPAPSEPDA